MKIKSDYQKLILFLILLLGLISFIIVDLSRNNNNYKLTELNLLGLAELCSFGFLIFGAIYFVIKNPRYVSKPHQRRKKPMSKRERQFH